MPNQKALGKPKVFIKQIDKMAAPSDSNNKEPRISLFCMRAILPNVSELTASAIRVSEATLAWCFDIYMRIETTDIKPSPPISISKSIINWPKNV